jgi:hypothetical protein
LGANRGVNFVDGAFCEIGGGYEVARRRLALFGVRTLNITTSPFAPTPVRRMPRHCRINSVG